MTRVATPRSSFVVLLVVMLAPAVQAWPTQPRALDIDLVDGESRGLVL